MSFPKLLVHLALLFTLVIPVAVIGQESFGSLDSVKYAAGQEDAESQYALGTKYLLGDGVAQDYTDAAKWFPIAAEQGHIGAQYRLGMLYREGKGVPQYYLEAAEWCRKAAEQDYSMAQISRLVESNDVKIY